MMADTSKVNDSLGTIYGRLVIDHGLATEAEVKQCQEEQNRLLNGESADPPNLPQLLVSRGIVTQGQIDRLTPLIRATGDAPQIPGYAIVNISLKPIGGIPGDATSDQMDAIADLTEKYSLDENL